MKKFIIVNKYIVYGFGIFVFITTLFTVKKQRTTGFDHKYYAQLGSKFRDVPDINTVSFSKMKFLPMPLHVVGGQGLMLFHPNVYDTPLTVFDTLDWKDTPESALVKKLPFYSEGNQSHPEGNISNQISFIKKYKIKFVWIEDGYNNTLQNILNKSSTYRLHSEADHISFLEINPLKL